MPTWQSIVKEYIEWMDEHNHVCDANSPYTKRLNRLTKGLTSVEGIPLNFKVYYVIDVNAFACLMVVFVSSLL